MTYDALEKSRNDAIPFELFWFAMGAENWRLTSGDVERSYLSNLYTREAITRTAIDQNSELSSGAITVTIPRTHPIARLFVGYIPPAPVALVIYRGHEGEGDAQVVTNFTGRVATALFREHCELTCVPAQDVLKRSLPIQRFQAQCNWLLYSPSCGVDKAAYAVTGTVTGIAGDTVSVSAAGTQPDGWFNAGWVEKGEYRKSILTHTGNALQLLTPLVGLQVGDAVTLYPGCGLLASICDGKFNNLAHFSGFPRIPTQNPFDGVE